MENPSMEKEKKNQAAPGQPIRITGEEYGALMAGMGIIETEFKNRENREPDEERFRRIEFYLMVLVGLNLAVFILCSAH